MAPKVALQIQHDRYWRNMLRIVAENGFRYVSMGFGSSKCFHRDDWQTEIGRIREELARNNLRCVMTHAPYYDLRISAEVLDEAMETALLRCVKATAMLGGEIMAVHPRGYYRNADGSEAPDGFYGNGIEIPEESCRRNIQNLLPLAEEAKRCGCRVGIENLPVFPGWTMTFCSNFPDIHKRIIDAFDPDAVCGIWDFGHSYLANEDPAAVLASFGGRIRGTHVHDNNHRGDHHWTPFFGTIDWKSEMAALGGNGYEGYLTMELEYDRLAEDPENINDFARTAYRNVCRLYDMLQG
ncbi:MAG: sugar phosphate isomerase/epimerase [Clostridia bacterium]|nr:sugar phosphate isomerase/epimerase [Clostridia bacterium]